MFNAPSYKNQTIDLQCILSTFILGRAFTPSKLTVPHQDQTTTDRRLNHDQESPVVFPLTESKIRYMPLFEILAQTYS